MTRKFQRYQLLKASRKFQKDLEKYLILLGNQPGQWRLKQEIDAFGVLLKEFNEEIIKIFY